MNGTLIRKAREAKGLSQRDLAQLAEVTQSLISFLESGERENASIPTVRRLARALDVSLEDLLTEPVAAPPAA